jgi:hypothetical protein
MADKLTSHLTNTSSNDIEIVGLVISYVECYLSQCE